MKRPAISLLLLLALVQSLAAEPLKSGRDLVQAAQKQIHSIDTGQLQQLLKDHPALVLVDVRTHDEVRMMGGTIDAPGNVVIPRGWLEFRIQQHALDAETPIVVYCGANIRSPLAALTLQQMGYQKVFNYADGYIGWRNSGLPTKAP